MDRFNVKTIPALSTGCELRYGNRALQLAPQINRTRLGVTRCDSIPDIRYIQLLTIAQQIASELKHQLNWRIIITVKLCISRKVKRTPTILRSDEAVAVFYTVHCVFIVLQCYSVNVRCTDPCTSNRLLCSDELLNAALTPMSIIRHVQMNPLICVTMGRMRTPRNS